MSASVPNADPRLFNPDLAPIPRASRDWTWLNMATVWMGMVHNVVAYEAAGGLMELGFSAWQALLATAIADAVLFVAMTLGARPGVEHGLPFCVLIRAAFGPRGAQIPVVLRGFVAMFWYSVQIYAGADAIDAVLSGLVPGWATPGSMMSANVAGLSLHLAIALAIFFAIHAVVVSHGVHRIRNFELVAGPLVIVIGAIATVWGLRVLHGLGPLFRMPSHLNGPHPWLTFAVGVTGMIGVWSSFAVNIPDLARFCRSERDQFIGQLVGLPVTQLVFMMMSVITTSASVAIFGHPIWDPMQLLLALHQRVLLVFGGATVVLATLSVNVAANIMPAAYDFLNIAPRLLRFPTAAMTVMIGGLLLMPWLWFRDAASIFRILGGLAALLGPVTGILLADHYLVRRGTLDTAALYRFDGIYAGHGGWNPAGLGAFAAGSVAALVGLVVPALAVLYDFSWFIGIAVAGSAYVLLAPSRRPGALPLDPARTSSPGPA